MSVPRKPGVASFYDTTFALVLYSPYFYHVLPGGTVLLIYISRQAVGIRKYTTPTRPAIILLHGCHVSGK